MFKMMVLYTHPAEEVKTAFDDYYMRVHVPLCHRLPGLVRAEVNKLTGMAGGAPTPYHIITELVFRSKDELDAAFASPEGNAVGKDTRNFPPVSFTIAYAEVIE